MCYRDTLGSPDITSHLTSTLGDDVSQKNYTFGTAKEQEHAFARDPLMDSLFCLAFLALSTTSFAQELHSQGKINEPAVGFFDLLAGSQPRRILGKVRAINCI